VWAFCPYGQQAEELAKPVYDLLKNKADFNIIFIGPVTVNKTVAANGCFNGQGKSTDDAVKACCNTYTINGTTIYSCGLHGNAEALETERQACIMKEYGKDSLWKYVANYDNSNNDVNGSLSSIGADASTVSSCMSSYGWYDTLVGDTASAVQNWVGSSPTILINGAMYSGTRTSDSLKTSLCSAFTTQPSECSK
jgi:hypothetical protein